MKFKFLAFLFFLLPVSCQTYEWIKPIKSSQQRFLSGSASLNDSIDSIREDLMRRDLINYFPLRLFVSLVPITEPLLRAKVEDSIYTRSQKERWSPSEEKEMWEKKISEELKRYSDKTCFEFTAIAQEEIGKEPHNWRAYLKMDGTKTKGEFETLRYFRKNYTQAYVTSGGYGSATTNTDHHLVSTVCFARKPRFDKPFSLSIEPQFQQDIDSIFLRWD